VSHTAASTSFAETWNWVGNTGNDHRDLGQSFLVPGTETLSLGAITLQVRNMGASAPGSPFHLEVWTVSDQFDGSADVLINSQPGVLPIIGLSSSSYWTFDVAPVALAPGGRYAFMLAFDTGPDAQRSVEFVEDFNSNYLQGRRLARNGTPTNWSSITNDAVFFLQFELPAPEPGGFVLLGVGMIGFASQTRKLRRRVWHLHSQGS
jgi:hypothetical protein